MTGAQQSKLRTIVDDLEQRIAAFPVACNAADQAKRSAETDRTEAMATQTVHHLRRTYGARIGLGGTRQRMQLAGVCVDTRSSTPALFRIWLTAARARIELGHR